MSRGVAQNDRVATNDEDTAFHARLVAALDKVKDKIAKWSSGDYEVRIMTIRSHEVRRHERKTFEKAYLAKKVTKRRRPRINPVAAAILNKRKGKKP